MRRFDWLKQRLLPLALLAFAAVMTSTSVFAAQYASTSNTSVIAPPFQNYGVVLEKSGNSYATHKNRARHDVANLFRAAARGEKTDLHVSCESLIDEYALLGLPRLEGCDLMANLIDGPDVEEIPCTQQILRDHYVARTNLIGDARDFYWSRAKDRCFKGETMLRYKPNGAIFTSTYCVNTLIARVWRAPQVVSVPPRESPFICVVVSDCKDKPVVPKPVQTAVKAQNYINVHASFAGPCTYAGQIGCLEARIMKFEAYTQDPAMRSLVDNLINGTVYPGDAANELYWKGLKTGAIRWKDGCYDYLVLTWGVNPLPLEAFRSYEGTKMENAKWDDPRKATTHHRILGRPTHVFVDRLCKGQGGPQFPNGYFRKGESWIMICPLGPKTVFPEQPLDWTSIERKGIWIGPEKIDEHIEGDLTSFRVSILY